MVIMHTFEQPTCVQPHILRTNCTVDGPFVITLYNKSLQEALLVTVNEASQDHCHTQCLLNDHCKSVNYHSDNKICELNSKTLGDSKTELKSMMGWMYQSTNYSSMAIGPIWREANRCLRTERCIATCVCPGYVCKKCDDDRGGLLCDQRAMKSTIVSQWNRCIMGWNSTMKSITVPATCGQFIFTESNRIKHAETGNCIIPEGHNSNSKLTLTSNCEVMDTIFQYTENERLRHVMTGYCLRVADDDEFPSIGSQYVIHSSCNQTKFRFFKEPQINASSCLQIKTRNPNVQSGVYKIFVQNTGSVDLFCDMTTDSGGWTLVWSYTFTRYDQFKSRPNAVTPIPNWPSSDTNVDRSVIPPSNEHSLGALEFDRWKLIGEEFLIKSSINHWISCKNGTGSFVKWISGSVQCKNVNNIASTCLNTSPDQFSTSTAHGPMLKISGKSMYYHFDGNTKDNWPTHDPCSENKGNQKKGVAWPGGNVFVR